MTMNNTFKSAFFEVKDWEKDYIYKALPKEDVILFGETLEEALRLNTSEVFANVTIISTFIDSDCSKKTLEKFPQLKFIATRSTGYDHIDLEYCKLKGIKVSNVPNYGQNTVAEHAMALLLTLVKRIPESTERIRKGNFSAEGLTGYDLKDKIIGVIGTGNIGKNFISMAKGFNMNVIAFDINRRVELEEELGFTYTDLDYIFAKSDIISLHIPYLKTTHHIIDQKAIDKMKKGVVIINTSRGGLIDTDALYIGLTSKKIGAAGLDVVEEENFIKEELQFLKEEEYLCDAIK